LANVGGVEANLGDESLEMTNIFEGKHIMLGVTGSIAAYKAADLASKLTQQGAIVTTLLTNSALEFVTPLTFQSVTGQKAFVDDDLWGGEGHIVHVQIGHSTDLMIIAPASANTIAKLAHGFADNLLTITALAASCPLVLAPAMDAGMFNHPATEENILILKKRGAVVVGPDEGHLASGLVGPGRMTQPQEIINEARLLLAKGGPLGGKRIIVTAGGTREAIDPVRYISNHSSGKQGFAIAQAALDMGSAVTLITAPNSLTAPTGCQVIQVETAEEMCAVVLNEINSADALIMSAAVADFKPANYAIEKIKKEKGLESIPLEPTKDILSEVAKLKKKNKLDLKVVGFAAESQDLKSNASRKMHAKGMDMIAANNITEPQAGFGVDTNKVLLLFSDGSTEQLPLMQKSEVAEKIIQHLISWLVEGAV
jgi:phosphopantothenoylcysteine decarboxylase/phosphopantothenate--cysteine ligase